MTKPVSLSVFEMYIAICREKILQIIILNMLKTLIFLRKCSSGIN